MLSSGDRCYHLARQSYHLGWDVIIWGHMLSSGTGVLSSGVGVIICVAHVIIWGKMLSSGIGMLSSGG